jgi:flagellin FlaB
VGNLNNYTFNSVFDAVAEAKKQGLIDVNPHIDQQGPNKTSAFVYWVINNNFDQRIDENELASLTIVYAEKDRPSTGESMFIQANVKEGYILKFERVIPNITNSIMNFGGKLNNP